MIALIVSVPATLTASVPAAAPVPWRVSWVAVVPSPVMLNVDPAGVWLNVIPPTRMENSVERFPQGR